MKTALSLALVSLAAFSAGVEAKPNKKVKDPVVMTIDGRDVTRSEFEYFYTKNTDQNPADDTGFDGYVDLFLNYKLKVAEAYRQGIDTTQAYQDELEQYRRQLAEPYLVMPGWADSLVNEVIRHRREEVRASHILLQMAPDASEEQSAAARLKLDSLKQEVKRGADFDSLARVFSQDPSARQNGGDLGYFSTMQMVYPFERAAYETPVGEMSLCRSRFGWHLVKVVDRRKAAPEVRVAHIMKIFDRAATPEVRMAMKPAMDSILLSIRGGRPFAEVAARESEDQYTAPQGGAYPWINRQAHFPEEWLDVAYSLQPGEVSDPFMTDFGWHIMTLLERRDEAPAPDEEEREALKKQLERDEDRQARGQEELCRRLRAEYAQDKQLRKMGVNKWTDEEVLAYEDAHLAEKYSDYAHLYREYHDGLMLFEVSSHAVWDKAQQDTLGLNAFFERNRSRYAWKEPRFKGAFIECADDPALVARLKTIYEGHDYLEAADIVRREVLTDTLLTPDPKKPRFHIVNGLYNPGDNATVDRDRLGLDVQVVPKSAMPVQMTYGRVLTDGPEVADDIRGQVVNDYQTELEQNWVEELRKRFDHKINRKELDAIQAERK